MQLFKPLIKTHLGVQLEPTESLETTAAIFSGYPRNFMKNLPTRFFNSEQQLRITTQKIELLIASKIERRQAIKNKFATIQNLQ